MDTEDFQDIPHKLSLQSQLLCKNTVFNSWIPEYFPNQTPRQLRLEGMLENHNLRSRWKLLLGELHLTIILMTHLLLTIDKVI